MTKFRSHILFLFLFLCGSLQAQTFGEFMQQGIEAYNDLDFETAKIKFEAARICDDISAVQLGEAEDWLDKANRGYIDQIRAARKEREAATLQADSLRVLAEQRNQVAEASRLAHIANSELENGNIEDAFGIALMALGKVQPAHIPLAIRSFGDAVQAKFGKRIQGHQSPIYDFGALDQHELFFTHASGGEVALWNKKGELQIKLEKHDDLINTVIASPNQQYLLTASRDGTAKIFSLPDGENIRVIQMPGEDIRTAAFSTQSDKVVLGTRNGSKKGRVKIVDLSGEGKQIEIDAHEEPISKVIVSPSGEFFVSQAFTEAKIWDWEGTLLGSMDHGGKAIISTVISPEESAQILTVGGDGLGKIWDSQVSSLKLLIGHLGPVVSGCFSKDGQRVLTCDSEGQVKLWNTSSGKLIRSFEGHQGMVRLVAFNQVDTRIFSAAQNAILWDTEVEQPLIILDQDFPIERATILESGNLILTASERSARLWDNLGNVITSVESFGKPISIASFLFDKEYFIICSEDGSFLLSPTPGYIYRQLMEGKEKSPSISRKAKKRYDLN